MVGHWATLGGSYLDSRIVEKEVGFLTSCPSSIIGISIYCLYKNMKKLDN
ncbi:hypothetical protein LguiB_013367 [Lonicera macranthoides]